MSKKILHFIASQAIILVLALPQAATASSVFNKHISLASNQVWTARMGVTRSGSHYDVATKCHSVYPVTGEDTFTRIQCKVVDSDGVNIMDSGLSYIVLNESAGYSQIIIKNGYLDLTKVYFRYRGNSSAAAEAIVSYLGK